MRRLFPTSVRAEHGAEFVEYLREESRHPRFRGRFGRGRFAFFVGVDAVTSHLRRVRTALVEGIGRLRRDLTHWQLRPAARSLFRARTFTIAVVGSLGVGVGGLAGVLAVAKGVLWSPLPFERSADLVVLLSDHPDRGLRGWPMAYPDYRDMRRNISAFRDVAAISLTSFNLSAGNEAERVGAARASASLFPTLGVAPVVGRPITADEDRVGSPPVVMLSEGLWRRRFGGASTIVGDQIVLDGTSYTVVGVFPASLPLLAVARVGSQAFHPVDVIVPAAPFGAELGRGARGFLPIARLAHGSDVATARAAVATVSAHLDTEFPARGTGWNSRVEPLRDHLVGTARAPIVLVLVGAGAVLLVVAANVCNLFLVRAYTHDRESAVRLALGAGRWQVGGHVLSQGILLGMAGGGIGIGIAAGVTGAARTFGATVLPRADRIVLDWPVVIVGLAVALITAMIAATPAAIQAGRRELSHPLRSGNRGGSARRNPLFGVLVAGEIAGAVVLLNGSALLALSYHRLIRQQVGYGEAPALLGSVELSAQDYPDDRRVADFVERVLDHPTLARATRAVGAISTPPPVGPRNVFEIVGSTDPDAEAGPTAIQVGVSSGYFEAVGLAPVAGRLLRSDDRGDTPPVVVISATLAARYFGDGDAVGRRIRVGSWRRIYRGGGETAPLEWEVVGVVSDVSEIGRSAEGPLPILYHPHAQDPWPSVTFVARTDHRPGDILPVLRAAIREVDAAQPLFGVHTLRDWIRRDIAQDRINGIVLAALAAIALVVAVVGVYGILAYAVSQRTREVGIRVAVGARPMAVLWLIVRQGSTLLAVGLALGVSASLASGRMLGHLLFDVQAANPITLAGVATVVFLVAGLATAIPALAATRLDPVRCLRA